MQKRIDIANYEKAIQTAFREVADGLAARGTYDNQIRSLALFTSTQRRRTELSELRYRNGVDSYLSVLTAQTDFYSAQQQLITARLQRLTNWSTCTGRWAAAGWSTPATRRARPMPRSTTRRRPAAAASCRDLTKVRGGYITTH